MYVDRLHLSQPASACAAAQFSPLASTRTAKTCCLQKLVGAVQLVGALSTRQLSDMGCAGSKKKEEVEKDAAAATLQAAAMGYKMRKDAAAEEKKKDAAAAEIQGGAAAYLAKKREEKKATESTEEGGGFLGGVMGMFSGPRGGEEKKDVTA